ncbi:hypothetical protein RFI_08370 [Reticulomyxa filosa]|uniref:Uncharacterized protein n=1 Tax=Reticulomyxa filosa TaxID=46433 RepID=X6NR19_RETFI|nr:hypothetical protein RFI_08370 [Reticulomyxa filosa]|eukprot:ETO28755.1 hypothetical protein RFI_08370 [Reticulomyxa filosa]
MRFCGGEKKKVSKDLLQKTAVSEVKSFIDRELNDQSSRIIKAMRSISKQANATNNSRGAQLNAQLLQRCMDELNNLSYHAASPQSISMKIKSATTVCLFAKYKGMASGSLLSGATIAAMIQTFGLPHFWLVTVPWAGSMAASKKYRQELEKIWKQLIQDFIINGRQVIVDIIKEEVSKQTQIASNELQREISRSKKELDKLRYHQSVLEEFTAALEDLQHKIQDNKQHREQSIHHEQINATTLPKHE